MLRVRQSARVQLTPPKRCSCRLNFPEDGLNDSTVLMTCNVQHVSDCLASFSLTPSSPHTLTASATTWN